MLSLLSPCHEEFKLISFLAPTSSPHFQKKKKTHFALGAEKKTDPPPPPPRISAIYKLLLCFPPSFPYTSFLSDDVSEHEQREKEKKVSDIIQPGGEEMRWNGK